MIKIPISIMVITIIIVMIPKITHNKTEYIYY